jgi:hypothetical protein
MTTKMTGCDFCRSRRLPWSKHSVEVCPELAKKQCTYCKDFGHTNYSCPKSLLKKQKEEQWNKREEEKRARWEANEKVRKEEKAKQEAAKANSWAAKATKNIPSDVATKIAEENRILAEQSEKKRAAEAVKRAEEEKVRKQVAKERWERNYVRRMSDQYGLKEEFVVPSKHYWQPEIRLPKGDFWYFKVEGTKNEHEIAKNLRDGANCKNFCAYLQEKYFVNWLDACEGTEDDCAYLYKLRDEEERRQWESEDERREQERKWSREWEEDREKEEKERDEMTAKLARGEISTKEFHQWEMEKQEEEWEEEDAYMMDGWRYHEEQVNYARAEAEWKARKEAREKK